jgi:hypothetical protein
MTATVERWAGADTEPERTPMTVPQARSSVLPWWAGVLGLDPAIPVDDWAAAARPTAMACAVRAVGVNAPYRSGWFKSSPASKWYDWLLRAAGPLDAENRRLALRLICDHATEIDVDDILQTAKDLLAAVPVPR